MEEVPGHPVNNAECRMQNAELSPAGGNAEGGIWNADLPEIGGTIKAVYYGESVADGGSRAPALRNEGEEKAADWKLKAAIEIERARAGV